MASSAPHGPIYSKFLLIQEIIGDKHLWPAAIRRLFFTRNLSNIQRLKICCFVFVNALNPEIFFEWVDLMGLCRDVAARRHMEFLFRTFEFTNRYDHYYSYSISMGRFFTIGGQEYNNRRHSYP